MKVPLLDLKAQYATIRDEVRSGIDRVMESQQFVLGPETLKLEEDLALYSQTKFAIGCASGSEALLLALQSCGVGSGDEVITTPFTFFATASAITRLGARPVFVDIDDRAYTIDPARVAEAITDKTKAIVPVHLYGQCAEMDPLLTLSKQRGIPIIEDAAQAIGAEERRRRAGSMGVMGTFSFYPSKNLGGAGDGGMLVTSDEEHTKRLRMLRVHGERQRYFHQLVGINSRLDELQATILHAKFQHLEEWTVARQRNVQEYEIMFRDAGLTGKFELPYVRPEARHVFHQFVIRLRDGKREALRAFLRERGVGSDVYYPVPLHLQESLKPLGYKPGDFPLSEAAANETLALPVYPELTPEQKDYVVESLVDFFR